MIEKLPALDLNGISRIMQFIPHMREIGLQIVNSDERGVEMILPFREDWIGDVAHGVLHPGIVSTLIDSACGIAVMSHIGKLEAIATIDLRMDYLWPAFRDHQLHCRAHCHRLSAQVAFADAEVWLEGDPKIIARARGAFMRSARGKERHYA